jgi:hypothetical protein
VHLEQAVHQKSGETGRSAGERGEARPATVRDEVRTAQREARSLGRDDQLARMLAKANMEAAWKLVKSNHGSDGVDEPEGRPSHAGTRRLEKTRPLSGGRVPMRKKAAKQDRGRPMPLPPVS